MVAKFMRHNISRLSRKFFIFFSEPLHASLMFTFLANEKIWDTPCDVFLPCAASRLVQQEQLDRLIRGGLQVISCGANVPFADAEIFYGPIAEKADTSVSLIPDFVANCGMARVFSYLMSLEDEKMSDAGIFEDTSTIIKSALQAIKKKSPERTLITQQAFTNALQQLM